MTAPTFEVQPSLRPWRVDSADFPTGGTIADAIEFCLRYAVLAPSGHNAQPWWFRIDGSSLTIGLDVSRGLAVVDPDDREAMIGVGAAAFMARTALTHFGFQVATTVWPDPKDPEACIRLDVADRPRVDGEVDALFEAITRRHTSRVRFSDQSPPAALLETLVLDARAEGADLTVIVDYPSRHALAEIVSTADVTQMNDKRFRRELASWMRSAQSRCDDGIRGYGSDLGQLMSVAAPLVVRTFDVGEGRAARDVELATGSPVLAVLTTALDNRNSWLRAGQALARVALRATTRNVSLGFLNQPIEVPHLRSAVADAAGTSGYPQLLLRLGYGASTVPQPRRCVDDVFRSTRD